MIVQGDCLDVLKSYPDNHFTSVITDPPYMIGFMSKEFDKFKDNPAANVDLWKEVLRVSKPGSTLLAFGGDRTHHHLMLALENAGWQIKTCIYWLTGQGFPKSYSIGKKLGGEWEGYGTALKPAAEIIVMAMKPNDGTYANNALTWGVSGINIDKGRIAGDIQSVPQPMKKPGGLYGMSENKGRNGEMSDNSKGRFPANILLEKSFIPVLILKDNIDIIKAQTIREYYGNYEVPSMWKRVQDVSEQNEERKKEVLQSQMLQQSSKELSKSNGGEEAHKEINRIDEEESDNKEGKEEPDIQGVLVQQRLPLVEPTGTNGDPINNCQTNDFSSSRNSGAPNNNGNALEATFNHKGNSSSSEWNKGRQSNREFRDNKQHQSHQNTFSTDTGKQTLEVLVGDVPKAWLRYFRPSGYSVIDQECSAAMLDEQSGFSRSRPDKRNGSSKKDNICYSKGWKHQPNFVNDQGGASRFFYTAKASKRERNAGCEGLEEKAGGSNIKGYTKDVAKGIDRNKLTTNHHPTVKPLALMKYLINLIMPPKDGLILDPFAGSGSTILAAKQLGYNAIGIEREEEYCKIARKRIEHVAKQYKQTEMING